MPDSDRAGQGSSYFRAYLRSLPDDIALAREAGLPVVLDVDRPLPIHAQRLMDTLGVEVRVSSQSIRGRGMGAYGNDGASRQPFEPNLIDFRHSVVQAHRRADAGDETLEICPHCMCEVDITPQPHRPGCPGIGGARATSSPVLGGLSRALPDSPAPRPPVVVGSARNGLDALERMDDGLPQEPELEFDVDEPDGTVLEEREPQAREAFEPPLVADSGAPAPSAAVGRGSRSPVGAEAASRSSSTANPYGLQKFGRGYIWTKIAALEAVRRFVAEHGRPPQNADSLSPTLGAFPSSKSVIQLFGTFDAMIVAAGFEPAPRNVRKAQVSRAEASALQPKRPTRERPVTAEDDIDESRALAEPGPERLGPDSPGSAGARDLTAVRAAVHQLVDAIFEALA